jgi:hypothetical protein
MIKTYLQFINEGRSVEISTDNVLYTIEKYAPWYNVNNVKEPIYRGLKGFEIQKEDGSYPNAFITKPSESIRPSAAYYNILIDNLPEWKDYPKRSKSLICSTDTRGAGSYGEVYRVIPLIEGFKLGVCPTHDLWTSFNEGLKLFEPEFHLRGLDDFDLINRELFSYLSSIHGKVDTTTYASILKAYEIFESLTSMPTEIARIRTATRGEKLIDFFNKVLDPVKNGFKHIGYNNSTRIKTENMVGKRYKEVWTSADCLLIKESLLTND